jgi:Fe-S-cluster containining protein
MASVEILETLRHACHGCGGSCQGQVVRLMAQERLRISAMAPALGIEDPMDGGGSQLRQVEGVCVFLDANNRCRIHAEFGPDAKPRICQQYPVIVTRTESGATRLGLDPGCLTTWRSWRDGPEVEVTGAVANRVELSPHNAAAEEALVDLCGAPDATVARVLGTLTGELPGDDALPAGFAGRWSAVLSRSPLAESLGRYGTSQVFQRHLLPVARGVAALDPRAPPPWPLLDAESEAFALEVCRRMLFLRLADHRGPPAAVAILTLGGAVACAWAHGGGGEVWATSLSAWTRALRSEVFWRTLFPDDALLRWLVTGRREGPGA